MEFGNMSQAAGVVVGALGFVYGVIERRSKVKKEKELEAFYKSAELIKTYPILYADFSESLEKIELNIRNDSEINPSSPLVITWIFQTPSSGNDSPLSVRTEIEKTSAPIGRNEMRTEALPKDSCTSWTPIIRNIKINDLAMVA